MTGNASFDQSDQTLFSLSQIQHLMRVEFNRAQRYNYPIVCMMVGVDRLGHLRDLYGYEAKEEMVDAVVGLLKHETRTSDFLGRMADDRLLAVIPHTPPQGAEVLAGRILAGARNLDFNSEGRTIQISLSIGASYSEGQASTLFFDSMLVAADEALTTAQSTGGGRYVAAPPGGVG